MIGKHVDILFFFRCQSRSRISVSRFLSVFHFASDQKLKEVISLKLHKAKLKKFFSELRQNTRELLGYYNPHPKIL